MSEPILRALGLAGIHPSPALNITEIPGFSHLGVAEPKAGVSNVPLSIWHAYHSHIPLTEQDAGKGLFLIDATWRYAEKMDRFVSEQQRFEKRSLPEGWKTAYPRKQEDCPSPEEGLASVEALFAAYAILGYSTEGLLDHYYWKQQFLDINSKF